MLGQVWETHDGSYTLIQPIDFHSVLHLKPGIRHLHIYLYLSGGSHYALYFSLILRLIY